MCPFFCCKFRHRRQSGVPPLVLHALQLSIAEGQQKTQVARDFGISRETLYQYLRHAES